MAVRRRPHRQYRGLPPLGPGGTPPHRGVQLLPIHRKGLLCGRPLPGDLGPGAQHRRREFGGSGLGDAAPIKTVSAPVTTRSRPSPSTYPHVRDGVPLYPPQPGPKKRPGRRNRRRSAPQDRGPAKLPTRKPRPANQRRRRGPGTNPRPIRREPLACGFTAIQRSTLQQR